MNLEIIDVKKSKFINSVDRVRASLSNTKYVNEKWLRNSEELFQWYYTEFLALNPQKHKTVFDLGAGAGYSMWFLREFANCNVNGLESSTRPDYVAAWHEFNIQDHIQIHKIIPTREVGYSQCYHYITAAGICFDRLDNHGAHLWSHDQYLFFIRDACNHLEEGGELCLRFNVPPKGQIDKILRSLNAWDGQRWFRIRRETFNSSIYA